MSANPSGKIARNSGILICISGTAVNPTTAFAPASEDARHKEKAKIK
jgi:hypothetical protein